MWERLRRFSSLDSEARGIFVRAAVLLPVIGVSLKLRGFRATQESLFRFLAHPQQPSQQDSARLLADVERIQLTARMVNAAVRHATRGSTCLEKSLSLWWLLGRQGIASELRIGARKVQDKFEAHAWIEHQGVAVNEPEDIHRHYGTFDNVFPLQRSETS